MIQLFRKIWRVIGSGASFSLFGLWGVCLAWIVLPLCHKRTPGTDLDKALACRRWVGASFRTLFDFMCWFGIFDFSVRFTSADLPSDKPVVLIANHPSLVDTVALLACFPELVVVAQSYMFNNPLLGPILRRCNFIDGGDGSPFAGAAVISAGVERLQAGMPVLIFPEGTRSGWSGLGTFRRGAFEMAQRAGVPLLPAFITTLPRTLMKGMRWYRVPVERVAFRIELGAPLHLEPGESSQQMMKRAQLHYEQRLIDLGMIRGASAPEPSVVDAEAAVSQPSPNPPAEQCASLDADDPHAPANASSAA
ncbi:MAG: 1-acyl-sn-glycerol-3-phosphate acyltransferase [Myxococcales bacterium]|jgi:1-acyl-sn-glycerol-3-phosphate acyltransferase|nr:1-acyl-sn-glycerol-3-phosphate acyltransferase [Myxococcales bacterium]